MSAFADDPDHFLRRFQAIGGERDGFAERRFYGAYLADILAEAEATGHVASGRWRSGLGESAASKAGRCCWRTAGDCARRPWCLPWGMRRPRASPPSQASATLCLQSVGHRPAQRCSRCQRPGYPDRRHRPHHGRHRAVARRGGIWRPHRGPLAPRPQPARARHVSSRAGRARRASQRVGARALALDSAALGKRRLAGGDGIAQAARPGPVAGPASGRAAPLPAPCPAMVGRSSPPDRAPDRRAASPSSSPRGGSRSSPGGS